MTSLTLAGDSYTEILYLHPYLDNGVPNFLKMWYGDSSYSYLAYAKVDIIIIMPSAYF